jgi:two-component system, response regulator PdtaR
VTPQRDGRQRSLTGSVLNRGLSVVVFHPDDNDGATLTNHLKRMGFQVAAFWPPLEVLPDKVDLVFRALIPEEQAPQDAWLGPDAPPVISIISYENPTFIDQALKMGSNAIITTPIRASGLLATVVFAIQNARQNRQMMERIASLEQKVSGARHLNEAKAILMAMHQISEAKAYEILRGQAMAKRVSVDDMCHSIIQAGELLKVKRAVTKPCPDDTHSQPDL